MCKLLLNTGGFGCRARWLHTEYTIDFSVISKISRTMGYMKSVSYGKINGQFFVIIKLNA